MKLALLLGDPLHHERYPAPGAPDILTITIVDEPEKRSATGYGGIGISPKRESKYVYHRLTLGSGPEDALVYCHENYDPQPEDEKEVCRVFGSAG